MSSGALRAAQRCARLVSRGCCGAAAVLRAHTRLSVAVVRQSASRRFHQRCRTQRRYGGVMRCWRSAFTATDAPRAAADATGQSAAAHARRPAIAACVPRCRAGAPASPAVACRCANSCAAGRCARPVLFSLLFPVAAAAAAAGAGAWRGPGAAVLRDRGARHGGRRQRVLLLHAAGISVPFEQVRCTSRFSSCAALSACFC